MLEKRDAAVEMVPHEGWIRASLVVDLSLFEIGAERQSWNGADLDSERPKPNFLYERAIP